MDESIIKMLMTVIKCGACGQDYEADSIIVLGHHEDLWFLSALCSACHTQSLMAAVVEKSKVPEVITDLTKTESDKFRSIAALTVNDVLDMHNFLRNFEGDCSQLLNLK